MFQRDILSNLRKWKAQPSHKPLIIRGARQVGKTTVVKEFAKEFDTFLHLNLERPADRKLFLQQTAVEDLLTAIYLAKRKRKQKGAVLLFIDEIQNSPEAIALLRYFYEDIPELYVIAAGSLLESLIDVHLSFPVGRVEYMALRPCSFAEFLQAMGETMLKEHLVTASLPNAIHHRVMQLFNEYVLVGGMPEAVALYADTKDIVALQKVYDTLLTGYRDDVEKYAKSDNLQKVLRYILTYGWQFAGQRIKFEHFANSNYKSREMGDAMHILEKALLLELVYPTTSYHIPIQADLKKSPKLLWLDTGLVNHVAGLQSELFGVDDISGSWKGKIAEHIVGQELIAANQSVLGTRTFWVREAKNSQAEVDFLHQYKHHIIPVEVKSGDNAKLKSLHLFMEQSSGTVAVRFWHNPVSVDRITLPTNKKYTLYNLPFYYAGHLDAFLRRHKLR
jgi:predicted AAA+ superfamily ATPase